jgi:hypothetical protein
MCLPRCCRLKEKPAPLNTSEEMVGRSREGRLRPANTPSLRLGNCSEPTKSAELRAPGLYRSGLRLPKGKDRGPSPCRDPSHRVPTSHSLVRAGRKTLLKSHWDYQLTFGGASRCSLWPGRLLQSRAEVVRHSVGFQFGKTGYRAPCWKTTTRTVEVRMERSRESLRFSI